jgi:2-polyprenyl-3-methyl-5-hydroxy-6-metoxy-1,4-benzoquinol methylase
MHTPQPLSPVSSPTPAVDPWEPIRQQYDQLPYPRVPLEQTPTANPAIQYSHNIVTAYYQRNRQVIDPKGKRILDAGCGSGYKSLMLAATNPGAHIVGIDMSPLSVELARQRLQYHGYDQAEFHTLALEDLPSLNQAFDYINCDDTLCLLPDPVAGLHAMKAVLKPDGILRVNFHSLLQRVNFLRAQQVGSLLHLMQGDEQAQQMTTMRAIMQSLKPGVFLKEATWDADYETNDQALRMNHLLRGDKGLTIPEFFALLAAAGLEFIRMVDWQSWHLMDLFDHEQLPADLAATLAAKPMMEQLHLYELFRPSHRLLDVWCGHPQGQPHSPLRAWNLEDLRHARVHLHPQLKTTAAKTQVRTCALTLQPFRPQDCLPLPGSSPSLEGTLAACLLPLWTSPQPLEAIAHRWQQLHPLNPVTLLPTHEAEALRVVQELIADLEGLGYVLVEPTSGAD